MFRRRSTAESEAPQREPDLDAGPNEPASPSQQGKGRPTPKRREAEQRRRQPLRAPRNRKEAYRQFRQRQRNERQQMREGMARGDERHLPARDRGPVRRLARDYVDSRRGAGEFFLYVAVAILVLALIPSREVQTMVYYAVWPAVMALVVGEAFVVARRIRKLAEQRYPDEKTRGVGFYAATRGLQIRRFRLPPPQVKRGERV